VESYRRKSGIVPLRDSTLLTQQISELSQELIRAREQVAIAESRLGAVARVNPNALGLNRDLDAARSRAASLEASLAELRKQGDVGSQSEIGLRALQREADADRNLYEKLLARARETSVQSGLQQPDAAVISRAERPVDPSFPKPAVMQPLFFVASCVVALLLVILLESLDRGFSTLEQLETTIGINTIGAIPRLRRLGRSKVESQVLDRSRSQFSESIRNLHTTLMLSGDDHPPKTVLIASSLTKEGKSSVALALARMLAACSKRVLLIDYDLRKSPRQREGDEPAEPGLIACLNGEAELKTALRRDPLSPAYILPAGGSAAAAPDLLGSEQMHALLAQLSTRFDLILLDGPPVLEGSDTRHLARLADATVFVVRWRHTRCATTAAALRQLVIAGARIKGTLLTMVEPKHFRRGSPIGLYRRKLSLSIGS
jgi:capsular exopolysaccharide synthesis family protein